MTLSGKVVYADLGGKGTEQSGTHRVIILKYIQKTDLAIVVPTTSNPDTFSKYGMTHHIRPTAENGFTTNTFAEVFHINSCWTRRFQRDAHGDIKVLGEISDDDKKAIEAIIREQVKFQ